MEFISLFKALEKIANHIDLGPHFDDKATIIGSISRDAAKRFWQENNPKIEHARGIGYASLLLNKALHDSNSPPQWMMFDEEKRFAMRSETAKERGLEMLTYATSWGNRRQKNCANHFRNSITQGDSALALEVVHVDCDDIVPRERILQFVRLGFDCAELAAFLDSNQIAHDMKPQAEMHSAEATEVSSTSTMNLMVKTRRNLLAPVIETAQHSCKDRFDTPAVWAALLSMVEARVKPLIGVCEDGIKWQDSNDTTQFLTLRSLRERLRRDKKKALQNAIEHGKAR